MEKRTYGIAGAIDPKKENDGKIDLESEVEDFLEGYSDSDKLKRIFALYAQKASTPTRISVTDITALTADQLDALRCGDQVVKQTSTMKHCYTVSYKDETTGGLCLTYSDCENIETVAYEKVEGVWAYQSTDITNIDSIKYSDVYIGVAADSATVISNEHHFKSVYRGRPIAFDTVDGYLFIIMPERYIPVVLMSGTEVTLSLDDTTTIEGVAYKIWKSTSELTGSFNIYLF